MSNCAFFLIYSYLQPQFAVVVHADPHRDPLSQSSKFTSAKLPGATEEPVALRQHLPHLPPGLCSTDSLQTCLHLAAAWWAQSVPLPVCSSWAEAPQTPRSVSPSIHLPVTGCGTVPVSVCVCACVSGHPGTDACFTLAPTQPQPRLVPALPHPLAHRLHGHIYRQTFPRWSRSAIKTRVSCDGWSLLLRRYARR